MTKNKNKNKNFFMVKDGSLYDGMLCINKGFHVGDVYDILKRAVFHTVCRYDFNDPDPVLNFYWIQDCIHVKGRCDNHLDDGVDYVSATYWGSDGNKALYVNGSLQLFDSDVWLDDHLLRKKGRCRKGWCGR